MTLDFYEQITQHFLITVLGNTLQFFRPKMKENCLAKLCHFIKRVYIVLKIENFIYSIILTCTVTVWTCLHVSLWCYMLLYVNCTRWLYFQYFIWCCSRWTQSGWMVYVNSVCVLNRVVKPKSPVRKKHVLNVHL